MFQKYAQLLERQKSLLLNEIEPLCKRIEETLQKDNIDQNITRKLKILKAKLRFIADYMHQLIKRYEEEIKEVSRSSENSDIMFQS